MSRIRRPTLKMIAEKADLGVTTVSRALKDGPEIALTTRNRVKQIAEELGYRPNRSGIGLRTGKTHTVSLILSPHAEVSGFNTALITGLTGVLATSGYRLQVVPDFAGEGGLALVRSIVASGESDGLIMSRTRPQDERVRFLLEHDFPFVTHGRTELATPHAWYDYDSFQFAFLAVEHLVATGCRRVMLIPPPNGYTYQVHMINGFERAVSRLGVERLEPSCELTVDCPPERIRTVMAELLASSAGGDGVLVAGDMAGLAAMAGCRDAGHEPGQDVHFVLKQTNAALDYILPAVDTLFEDLESTGHELARLLLRRLQGDPIKSLQYLQPPQARFQSFRAAAGSALLSPELLPELSEIDP